MASPVPDPVFLLVCFNRRETTVRCIRSLLTDDSVRADRIVLFDDASTDGTKEAALTAAPGLHLVEGDGSAFWNGGLYRAWTEALKLETDAFIWLNDDVELDADALSRMREAWREASERRPDGLFILVGATKGQDGQISYCGYRRVRSPWALRFAPVHPSGALTPIDTFNGNFVVVPKAVVNRIGLNDPVFHQSAGDTDYGLRARAAGMDVLLMAHPIGRCEPNTLKAQRGFGSRDLTLAEQWRVVNTHLGLPFRNWFWLTLRYSGVWFPLHFLLPYRWLVLPRWLHEIARRG